MGRAGISPTKSLLNWDFAAWSLEWGWLPGLGDRHCPAVLEPGFLWYPQQLLQTSPGLAPRQHLVSQYLFINDVKHEGDQHLVSQYL